MEFLFGKKITPDEMLRKVKNIGITSLISKITTFVVVFIICFRINELLTKQCGI